MLAAQVNARKHDKLRIILGFDWSWGLGLCEALLCWVLIAAAAAGRVFGLIWTEYPPPFFACWRELWVPIALCSDRSSDGCSPHCYRIWCFWWASVQGVRVYRGRFCDVSLRLRSMFAHRCIAVCSVVGCCTCYAGMWVSCL